jgi:hypothetical protein
MVAAKTMIEAEAHRLFVRLIGLWVLPEGAADPGQVAPSRWPIRPAHGSPPCNSKSLREFEPGPGLIISAATDLSEPFIEIEKFGVALQRQSHLGLGLFGPT